jgi:hypothetical protein
MQTTDLSTAILTLNQSALSCARSSSTCVSWGRQRSNDNRRTTKSSTLGSLTERLRDLGIDLTMLDSSRLRFLLHHHLLTESALELPIHAQKNSGQLHNMVSWCSWLSRESNTLKVSGSSLGEIRCFFFLLSETCLFSSLHYSGVMET